jgi:hypothetical protein
MQFTKQNIADGVLPKDVNYHRGVSAIASVGARTYIGCDMVYGPSYTVTGWSLPAEAIITVPIWLPRQGGHIDRVSCRIVSGGAAGSNIKLALYSVASDSDAAPDALLAESGDIVATSTGVKSFDPNIDWNGGLLWAAIWANSSWNGQVRCNGNNMMMRCIFGVDDNFDNPSWGLARDLAYVANFPNPLAPVDILRIDTLPYPPMIGVRFSS